MSIQDELLQQFNEAFAQEYTSWDDISREDLLYYLRVLLIEKGLRNGVKDQEAKNTDVEIWRETLGDYYSPSISVTKQSSIAIHVRGRVLAAPIEKWFAAGESAFCIDGHPPGGYGDGLPGCLLMLPKIMLVSVRRLLLDMWDNSDLMSDPENYGWGDKRNG